MFVYIYIHLCPGAVRVQVFGKAPRLVDQETGPVHKLTWALMGDFDLGCPWSNWALASRFSASPALLFTTLAIWLILHRASSIERERESQICVYIYIYMSIYTRSKCMWLFGYDSTCVFL